jgi:hypothetical protein
VPNYATLRRALETTIHQACLEFEELSILKGRHDYEARGKLGESKGGSVYAFFDRHGAALYIGEAGRPFKRRQHDELAAHKHGKWWKTWRTVRFVPMKDRTDRLTLELLLILGLRPKFNRKPSARELDLMFLE